MTKAKWLGFLTAFVISVGAITLVVLLSFNLTIDMFLLITALLGGPMAGAIVHNNLTRRAMGLTEASDLEEMAARLHSPAAYPMPAPNSTFDVRVDGSGGHNG